MVVVQEVEGYQCNHGVILCIRETLVFINDIA